MENILSFSTNYFDESMAAQAATESLGGLSTRKFVRRAKNDVVYHGKMSLAAADRVFRGACAEWDVGDMNVDSRDSLLGDIAEALLRSTSMETDMANVTFTSGDDEYELDVLVRHAMQATNQPNPLRVWIRSFKNGEVAARMSDMLADPANSAIRQQAAMDYGATPSDAYLCFDMADALVGYRVLTQSELSKINRLKAFKLRDAAERATAKGMDRTEADRTGTVGHRSLAADIAVSQGATTTPQVRTSFAKVN